jgi:S-DNA-T family DNA segregation ATPase FtsK/SpoIIIE
MAANNPDKRGKLRRSDRQSGQRWFALLVLVVLVLLILYWQWSALSSLAADIGDKILGMFGWGLVIIAVIVMTAAGAIWRRQLSAFAQHWKLSQWHKWLGSMVFMLAIWGILALFNLGGSFGRNIIGDPLDFIDILLSALWILGLIVVGVIFVAPRASFHWLANFLSWVRLKIKARIVAKQTHKSGPSRPSVAPISESLGRGLEERAVGLEPREKAPGEREVSLTSAPTPAYQELKEVAQEVWKKYGESPSLVVVDGWKLPPLDILDETLEVHFTQADNAQRARLIEEAMASYGVDAKVVQINVGPTVTQFGIEPGWARKYKKTRERDKEGNINVRLDESSKTRVKVERITSLANDLALALAASSLRIEAPVPGQSIIGIEVPNSVSIAVGLRGAIETNVFQKMESKSKLAVVLGKGAGGETIAADLAKMPHLLIAGSTGSGKTVCLNTIICCLLLYNSPSDVRFIMIDPKRVELTSFNSIPHLAETVIVDSDKALEALRWLSQEMDKRYQKLSVEGARNIEGYNKSQPSGEKMPYLVLIIDELADLMMRGSDEVERILCRLAQLSRAIGIHLVVATQRPSVDVVTGLIKANFPTRISFAVTSQVDSRTILDSVGAEKLLGKGDMLYMPTEADKPKRLQGCFVSDAEIERLVYFWGSQRREEVPSLKIDELSLDLREAKKNTIPEDPFLEAARKLELEHKQISASFLQRRLRIGYPRAARLMEELEEEGKKEGGEG